MKVRLTHAIAHGIVRFMHQGIDTDERSVFEKFGGIRPMAAKLGLSHSTVKSWHTAGSIPEWRRKSVMDAAIDNGITITFDEIANVRPNSEPFRRGAPVRDAA